MPQQLFGGFGTCELEFLFWLREQQRPIQTSRDDAHTLGGSLHLLKPGRALLGSASDGDIELLDLAKVLDGLFRRWRPEIWSFPDAFLRDLVLPESNGIST